MAIAIGLTPFDCSRQSTQRYVHLDVRSHARRVTLGDGEFEFDEKLLVPPSVVNC